MGLQTSSSGENRSFRLTPIPDDVFGRHIVHRLSSHLRSRWLGWGGLLLSLWSSCQMERYGMSKGWCTTYPQFGDNRKETPRTYRHVSVQLGLCIRICRRSVFLERHGRGEDRKMYKISTPEEDSQHEFMFFSQRFRHRLSHFKRMIPSEHTRRFEISYRGLGV